MMVYKHEFPNGKVYIGVTNNDNDGNNRWLNGNGYSDNIKMNNAIKKYGWNKIKTTVMYSNISERDALVRERELILAYDSENEKNGYNRTHIKENLLSVKGKVVSKNKKQNKNQSINVNSLDDKKLVTLLKRKIKTYNEIKKDIILNKEVYTIHRKNIIHILSTWEREYDYCICYQEKYKEAFKIKDTSDVCLNGMSVSYVSRLEYNNKKTKMYAYVPDLERSISHIEKNREWSKEYIIKKKKKLSELREQINECIKCIKERRSK